MISEKNEIKKRNYLFIDKQKWNKKLAFFRKKKNTYKVKK